MPGKRKSKVSGTPLAKRSKSKWAGTKFGTVLENAGLILGGTKENLLKVDPAVFQRDLASTFRSFSGDIGINEFIDGLRDYLEDHARLKTSILPTGMVAGAEIRARFGGLDSLMRLLMGVDVLQPYVIDLLLGWLPDFMGDGEAKEDMELQEYLQMPKLMLSQLRMLDHLVDGKDLCDKLLQVVEIAPPQMQREIITALPEMLDDSYHNDAAQKLKSILMTNSDLTAAVIDALSNLNADNTIIAEILEVVLNCLRSSEIGDLPTVIRFINEHLTPSNAQEVVSEIREKLNLDFIPVPIISSTPQLTQRQMHNLKMSNYFMVLDTIRSSICFQKVVADGWVKAITSVTEPEDHRVIDVFVLFVLYSITAHKKTVERIFSNKIRAGCFSDDLMNSVFGSYAKALRDFFPSLLQLSKALLCNLSPSVATFGVSFYQHIFISFDDVHCQQAVVDALVIHVSNGMRSEVDHALDILLTLLEHYCKYIVRYSPLVKRVLDYLSHLTILQIHKLYQILATLAFSDLEETSSMQSELHTIIRKQLTHYEARYRHIGVIGSIMIIRQISRQSDSHEDDFRESNLPNVLTSHRQQMARTMLDEVMATCSYSGECSVLFCDEMSSVVDHLDSSLLTHLCEKVTNDFQDSLLVEMTDGIPEGLGIPVEYTHGLDSTDEGSIALNLLPLVIASRRSQEGGVVKGEGLIDMAARFHLLRKCEQQLNGSLEGIDALLGCPVLMCPDKVFVGDTFEEMTEFQRMDICLSLFHCINWFRELVCAFGGEDEVDMKGKVMIRLQNITELQDRLGTCITGTPEFWPPSVNTSEVPASSNNGREKSTKNDVTLASITAATISGTDTTSMDKVSTSSVPIDRLHPYFRQLDLSVFKVFHIGCLSRTMLDSDQHTEEKEELRLQPPQLIFLLQDLCNKLTTTFTTFAPKANKGDGGLNYTPADLVKTMTEMTGPLCEQMEKTCAFFQAQLTENDGVMDIGGNGKEYSQLCFCFYLLLKAFSSFFGWPNLSGPHFSENLRSCLTSIISRTNHTSSQHSTSLPLMAPCACKFFQNFSDFLPTLTCGHLLAKVLVGICKTCEAKELQPTISGACGSLLQRPWKAAENTQLRNSALTFLLKYHIEWARDSLVVVETLACDGAAELLGEEALEKSSRYPTLTSATFPCFYRCMMSSMVSQLKAITGVDGNKSSSCNEHLNENFYTLQISTKVFSILVNMVQSFDKRTVLSSVLKLGKAYIEAFSRYGMPILNSLFPLKKADVLTLLKTLQQSTRFLHHCCGHSKVLKDTTLINHVPQLKKCLETLLFRVKGLMADHNCQEAFWMGNLKNRDLKGQEILSQLSSQANQEECKEEEEEEEEEDEYLDLDQEVSDTAS